MKNFDTFQKIIISRTDSIGDVCLTLPICRALKEKYPKLHLIFFGKTYTQSVIEACPYVDEFLDFSKLELLDQEQQMGVFRSINADCIVHVFPNKSVARMAKKSGIPVRIGTSHRLFHLTTCNVRLNFTRKNSNLHESQLNFELLKPFGMEIPEFDVIRKWHLLSSKISLPDKIENLLKNRKKVILHCKSQGSAIEWGISRFMELAHSLAIEGFQVFFTGTEAEGVLFREQLPVHERIVDLSGQMSLAELLAFIERCDVLVAASTGPLHLAGLLGTKAIGLFSSRKPIHPGRWQALGSASVALVYDKDCLPCKRGENCPCIEQIQVQEVMKNVIYA